MAVTTAEVTDRKGAQVACKRCKAVLNRVQSVLTDSGYTGEPFARGVREVGEQVTVQIAKRSELHTFKVCPRLGGGAQLCWAGQESQAIEELRALAQYQPAVRPLGIPGVAAQKIVNTFSWPPRLSRISNNRKGGNNLQ